jgi:hypothetical protein
MNGMNFIARNSIKALVALIAIGVVGMVADRYLAASPSASTSKSTKADSRPRVEAVHPRRITVAQRLQPRVTTTLYWANCGWQAIKLSLLILDQDD